MSNNKEFHNVQIDVSFDKASKRDNIVSGENIALSLGKIAKWRDDFGNLAWESAETTSIGSATAASENIAADDITSWSEGSLPELTTEPVSVPNVSHIDDVSVTVNSVKTQDTPTECAILSGALIFTKGTPVEIEQKTTEASKVTLGDDISIDGVKTWDAGALPNLEYTDKSIPDISVTPVTNVLRKN